MTGSSSAMLKPADRNRDPAGPPNPGRAVEQLKSDLTKGNAFSPVEAAAIAEAMVRTVTEDGRLTTDGLFKRLYARHLSKSLARQLAEVIVREYGRA